MYEELVQRLRYDSELLSQDGWAAELFTEAADAIEELSKQCVNIGDLDCDSNQLCTCMGIVRKRLEEAEKKSRWIPVTERLPEDFQKVLVFWREHSEPMVDTAFWRKDAKRFDGEHLVRMGDKITYWMPLPEPPEEEDNG